MQYARNAHVIAVRRRCRRVLRVPPLAKVTQMQGGYSGSLVGNEGRSDVRAVGAKNDPQVTLVALGTASATSTTGTTGTTSSTSSISSTGSTKAYTITYLGSTDCSHILIPGQTSSLHGIGNETTKWLSNDSFARPQNRRNDTVAGTSTGSTISTSSY